jgi:DNA invertase Pin-like site-specific DNA recombinase
MTRAVIYARYSSDLQSDASIEDQVRLAKERISREGWRLLSTYSDRAQSGASALRVGYQKLLEDARGGKFDIVVAEALDRLTRDQEDVAALYKHLSFAGVKLITIAEGEITELHVGLKGTMNALFLKDLAQKVRRGLRGRVEAGRSGGGNCYGYDVVREYDAHGEPIHGGRTINTVEAEVVRRIFREFAAGKSPRRIAFALNAEAIQAPGGAGWGASTINGNAARGTGILNNELYIGRLVWNRLRYIKDPRTGKRISRLNAESDQVIHDAAALRIVEQKLWDAAKARQQAIAKDTRPDCREEKPFWARTRPKYMFSGLMRCGVCGGAYSKISANLFGRATARNKGTCGNRLNIRRDVLEATVLDGLKHRLMDPDLYKVFIDEFIRETNRLRSTESSKGDKAKADLAAIERRLKKIVDAIADGVPARRASRMSLWRWKRDRMS